MVTGQVVTGGAPDPRLAARSAIAERAGELLARRSLARWYWALGQITLATFRAVAAASPAATDADLAARLPLEAVDAVVSEFREAGAILPGPELEHAEVCLVALAERLGRLAEVREDNNPLVVRFVIATAREMARLALQARLVRPLEVSGTSGTPEPDTPRTADECRAAYDAYVTRFRPRPTQEMVARAASVSPSSVFEFRRGRLNPAGGAYDSILAVLRSAGAAR